MADTGRLLRALADGPRRGKPGLSGTAQNRSFQTLRIQEDRGGGQGSQGEVNPHLRAGQDLRGHLAMWLCEALGLISSTLELEPEL